MFWEGRVLVKDGVRATFRQTIRWAVEAEAGTVVLLGHEARVLSEHGVNVVPTPRLDKCWAIHGGVLAQGEGVWVMLSVLEGFQAVDADEVLDVVGGIVIYRVGDEVLEGTLVRGDRQAVDMDQTMYAGIEVQAGGWRLEPIRRIHLEGPTHIVKADQIYVCNGSEVVSMDGKRRRGKQAAAVVFVGPDPDLSIDGVLYTRYGPLAGTIEAAPRIGQMVMRVLEDVMPLGTLAGMVVERGWAALAECLREVLGLTARSTYTSDPLARMMLPHPVQGQGTSRIGRALHDVQQELALEGDIEGQWLADVIAELGYAGPSIVDRLLHLLLHGKPVEVHACCERIRHVVAIYSLLRPPLVEGCHAAVAYLVEHNLSTFWLDQMPPDVSIPIWEAVRVCRLEPRSRDARLLERVGRRDLARRAKPTKVVRFASDKRLDEVERIMQTSRVRAVDHPPAMINNLAHRTQATTVGRGAYTFGTVTVDQTRAIHIEPIETSIKMPMLVKAQVESDWPRFHNGASAALAIDRPVDPAWIMYCKPQQLDAEYAGLLLGLGLGKRLSLRTFDAFSLLESRHDLTTIGLLLGLAATHAGKRDETITKALSLHTQAFLPMGSVDLNAPILVQATAMLGLGLVHVGSGNMRMAKVAAGEIRGDEAYASASALAVGLVMLGKGQAPELGDSPAAILALGLVHLKTGNRLITLPDSDAELDTMPPESLLYRVFAQSLMTWDAAPSVDWVQAQVPSFISETSCAWIHAVAGACMAIGVKYAGSASEPALYTILRYHGILARSAASGDSSYEGKIRRRAARQAIDVVVIAMCAVMSGTGEIGVLRRLRVAHGQEGQGIHYGTHMALHMAIGLLFMGKGYYTLGATDLAVAAMTIAFFPRFALTPDNNTYPQAFRHLWALAAEPRCLVARDVDTGKVENVPLRVQLREGEQKLMSPTLVCPFEQIRSVEVDSVRYWPVSIKRDWGTIHVQRRSAFLDYGRDNKGTRSIHARVGSLTGFDMHYDLTSPAAPPAVSADEVIELVHLHSHDPLLHGHARVFAGAGGEFARSVLIECLVLDKPEALTAYHVLKLEGTRLGEYYKVWPERFALHARDRTLPLIRAPFLHPREKALDGWQERVRKALEHEGVELVAWRLHDALDVTYNVAKRFVERL